MYYDTYQTNFLQTTYKQKCHDFKPYKILTKAEKQETYIPRKSMKQGLYNLLQKYLQNFSKAKLPNFQNHETHFRSHFETP